ncbi:YHS domain-containing protein [Salinisphaera sp. G21_0]|uniref:YHS domain-containing (seleno)protein n=1 Tax=Thalassotalea sp. G20_0 TaxID=2821093 RepID=UPI001ADABC8F|nr:MULTISPECIES: YHS domain-containing (seleno)protein [Gammaproteobacteria]MBO9483591.1 YHS domain-containing protein [Salinisphaera sp. G21_0]MBO9496363.1 YHS domain-containing protein [Thalassotalea sp. G20_0]
MNTLLRIASVLLMALSVNTFADKHIYTGWFSSKAINGYDAVAYFTEGKPIKGSAKYKFEHLGVEWYFSSEKHLSLFKTHPEQYMPQYGGYCAWAVAATKQRAPGDPKYWKIVDDKLYLNYDNSVQEKWLVDIPGFIKAADKNWPEMN